MEHKDEIRAVIDSLCGLAELADVYFDALKERGFSEQNALYLTSRLIGDIIHGKSDGDG